MRYLLILVVAVAFTACDKDPYKGLTNEEEIEAYIADNNLTVTETDSGLRYFITTEGDGNFPDPGASVTVRYTGYFTDGEEFDGTSGDNTVTFDLDNLIAGWKEGIPLLSRGGAGTFILPSSIGYGSFSQGSIPGNSVLVFDIELVDF